MTTYMYLYDTEKDKLPSMDVGLNARINASKKLIKKLQKVKLKDRDDLRIRAVLEAIEINKKFLNKEL